MRRSVFLPLSLAVVLVADQLVKRAVCTRPGWVGTIAFGSAIRIRQRRSGPTLAGRAGLGSVPLWSLWVGSLVAVLALGPASATFDGPLASGALGAALGGAASNLLDLSVRKGVIDYVEVGPWPAFNLADAAIVTGVIVGVLAH